MHVDVDATPDEAFGLHEEYGAFSSEWHTHEKHQILFAASGTMSLVVDDRRWTLPPQRAALVPARARHRVASVTGVALRTVYFSPVLAVHPIATARVFAVTPLAREMILHAMRWGPSPRGAAADEDATRAAFFRALAGLTSEWLEAERPYYLPEAKSKELAAALAWIGAHLEDATIEGAASAAHVSVRTLARRFEDETQTTFRAYVQSARMMRAMELLAEPRASIASVAYEVGFQSVGAFTTAFRERCGETPTEYRARAGGGQPRRTVNR